MCAMLKPQYLQHFKIILLSTEKEENREEEAEKGKKEDAQDSKDIPTSLA